MFHYWAQCEVDREMSGLSIFYFQIRLLGLLHDKIYNQQQLPSQIVLGDVIKTDKMRGGSTWPHICIYWIYDSNFAMPIKRDCTRLSSARSAQPDIYKLQGNIYAECWLSCFATKVTHNWPTLEYNLCQSVTIPEFKHGTCKRSSRDLLNFQHHYSLYLLQFSSTKTEHQMHILPNFQAPIETVLIYIYKYITGNKK